MAILQQFSYVDSPPPLNFGVVVLIFSIVSFANVILNTFKNIQEITVKLVK